MGQLTKARAAMQKTPSGPVAFKDILRSQWPRMAAVMPRHMNSERMFQLAVSCYNQTPELAECSPQSILSCLMKCSALGLEPSAVDGLGRAYILPYYNKKSGRKEAQLIIGYKGMLDLARRSGRIRDISARAVHEGDEFRYEYGLHEDLVHIPSTESPTDRPLTHVYMVAHFNDGGHYIEVMSKAEVDEIKKRSKASKYGPWVTDYVSMALKTVIRRGMRMMPMSVEQAQAVYADETTPDAYDAEGEPIFEFEDAAPEDVDPKTGEIKEDSDDDE